MPFVAVSFFVGAFFAAPPIATKKPTVPVATPPVATRIYEKPIVLRKEDPDLEKRVSVDKPFVYMGELLELLCEQTGVAISASDADGAAGEELTAVLEGMPLADVMDSLVSLLSRRGVRWQWRREGKRRLNSPYTYRLLRPEGYISAYAEAVKRQVQIGFEKDADMMIAGLSMSPDELKRKAVDHPHLSYLNNGHETPYGIRAFRDCLTPAQRLQVLRSRGNGIEIPLSELAPAGQRLEKYAHDLDSSLNPGSPLPPTKSAAFWVPKTDGYEVPTLYIGFDNLGGWSYIGGKSLQAKLLSDEEKEWTHEDEARTNPDMEARKLSPPQKKDPNLSPYGATATPRRFRMLGREGGFSVLARPQRDDHSSTDFEPWRVPIGEYLTEYRTDHSVIHKWRKTSDGKPVLLLDFSGWYIQDADPQLVALPWAKIKRLRTEQAKNTNESVFSFIVLAANTLTGSQQERVKQNEFRIVNWVRERQWFYPFAKWIAANPNRYKQLLSSEGVSMAEVGFAYTPVFRDSEKPIGSRVRVAIQPDTEKAVACRIEFLARDGSVIVSHALPTWEAGYSPD